MNTPSQADPLLGRLSRPLHRRLSPERRTSLVAAHLVGARQRDLAAEYGIGIRSVKRLIREARDAGTGISHPIVTRGQKTN